MHAHDTFLSLFGNFASQGRGRRQFAGSFVRMVEQMMPHTFLYADKIHNYRFNYYVWNNVNKCANYH